MLRLLAVVASSAVALALLAACGTGPKWDGAYSAVVTTLTPAGNTTMNATFQVLDGAVSDPGVTFTGRVLESGDFDGTTRVCDVCAAQPLAGTFQLSGAFNLDTCIGSGCTNQKVQQHVVAQKL